MTTLLARRLHKTAPRADRDGTSKHLDALRRLVEEALRRFLPQASSSPGIVHEGMRYCVFSGGKRFRPLLCLGGAEAVGANVRQALPAACAVELIHTYSLVHDDLPSMDNADQRRGQPTCHRKFGEGNAVLVGDALLTLAFDLLSRNGTQNALAVIQTISRACGTVGLIGGQVLDLQVLSQSFATAPQAMREIAKRKTAALMIASVVAGGLSGGGSAEQLRRLQRYGERVGLAFQLIDDVHDGDGLAQTMGRDAASAEAQRLLRQALGALEPFGARTAVLRQLAAWLGSTA
jgi:geranylgeranyl diphosphate synthase type II